ncbi:sulfite exporter TauE/SafE family protein [Pseudogulbenkiania subflava]|uniref:sulfite exporter TauE/SafE family protein n=1 Tax=Pseudogulbenkiania subflava TaxID=451637 RepID=UPI001F2672B0|nr:sulfite exporter TauE/SafE family protein [Pseudogulbenkiania subflava]
MAGLLVGFVVGLTGVGGGSLMTPILVWFGIPPATAVGTDLLYAAITKAGGVMIHHRQRHVDWGITTRLAAGSLPAALLTLFVLSRIELPTATINAVIKVSLGAALILTALAILFKPLLVKLAHRINPSLLDESRSRTMPTVLIGVMLGVLVTLSSIGAGALGTLALFLLYPALPTTRLVGTEIAHAVPLTLVAGIGHASLGNLDYGLLVNLLMGSLPGIWMGSRLTKKMAERWMRPALAIMLAIVGTKLVY